ncbi:hypothetical protein [Glycomyces sp. MUSA5-2]|uniref:hypothetical protein n=1 Tax=Glycomyces sp. MUSA5-2 TaxID=2053002 RepID=UPI0030096219
MISSQTFLKHCAAAGVVLAALAAAGCGGGEEPESDVSASDAAAAPATSGVADPSGRPSPSPSEAESTEPATEEAAADDAGYEDCGDGACEVPFSGSVQFPLTGGDGQWTVDAVVEDGGVQVSLTKPNGLGGGGGFLDHPSCALTFRADGSGGLACDEEPAAPDSGGIVLQLTALDGDDATVAATLG